MLDLIHPHGTGLRDPQAVAEDQAAVAPLSALVFRGHQQAISFQGGVMFSFTPLALFGRRFCRG